MNWKMVWRRSGPMVQRRATCESCGEPFACEVSLSGCWCADVELTSAARTELSSRYTKCLCPTCLRRYEATARPAS